MPTDDRLWTAFGQARQVTKRGFKAELASAIGQSYASFWRLAVVVVSWPVAAAAGV
jgi:hypothetical protein